MGLTVSQVAKLAGVSVRALHHYDELGLLSASERSAAGYRLYSDVDLQRLQQVLFFKELGFALEAIRSLMGDPKFELRSALLMQRHLLEEKVARLKKVLAAVDAALASEEEGRVMRKEEMFEVFGSDEPARYEEEAKQRWGDTAAYQESARRTARYGKKEWQQIKDEGDRIFRELAALLAEGVPAASDAAVALAERHRAHIDRWFYPCSKAMHRAIAESYVTDSRFTQNIDRYSEGVAAYARDAIAANAQR